MNSTPISRKPYDAYKSKYEGMADALSGWGLFREGLQAKGTVSVHWEQQEGCYGVCREPWGHSGAGGLD